MTTETLTIVLSAIGIVLTLGTSLFAAGAWMVRRVDDRFDTVEQKLTDRIDAVDEKLSARIDAVDEKLTARIDAVDEKLSARIDAVAADVTDLKISVARLEGPPRHLLAARG
ncbi:MULTISPECIES: hypothetical protein [Microbacterium]|uniref:Uncharacterized protein n=1 Tax=Microbacterium maritypicum MF109 TaxID=1333857 RepID=T5KQW8_MICMQ|nr:MULTISPECIES: hypothetical protein [Microbacterium]EQM86048.1 hypothetical protein L687_10050 [Microbacterium maritypicum MF109]NIG65636.1 hypothetical protein [Microbacterium sp. Be9]